MHWLTALFIIGVLAQTATREWLATRQICAVQLYRDRVPEQFRSQVALPDHQKAADYTIARARLGRWQTVVSAAMALLLTLGGGIAAIDALWRSTGVRQPWQGALVVASVFLLMMLIGLPLSIWRTFRLEARFGFNRISPSLYVADLAKHLLLALLLGAPLVLAAIILIERAGKRWWLIAWAGWLCFTLLLTWAWPRFIAPLFNRFTPLADEALKMRVEAVLERCGFSSKGVFVMDGSRRSTHGNAYFTGVGRNKRIVFLDTLIERLGVAEIEAVLAHELGHFRLNHVRQRLVVSMVTSFFGLAVLAWLAAQPAFYTALGVPRPSPQTALLLFALLLPALTYFVTPIAAWWSRRHEFAADDFAVQHAEASALAAGLVKLYRDNASTLTPDRLHSAFYDSHPPAPVRIARLNTAAQHNPRGIH